MSWEQSWRRGCGLSGPPIACLVSRWPAVTRRRSDPGGVQPGGRPGRARGRRSHRRRHHRQECSRRGTP